MALLVDCIPSLGLVPSLSILQVVRPTVKPDVSDLVPAVIGCRLPEVLLNGQARPLGLFWLDLIWFVLFCLVLFRLGLVWSGLVWCGLFWSGLVWFWSGQVWSG